MKTYLTGAGFTTILIVVFLLLSSPLSNLEEQALDVKFILRGEQKLDSNVIVIYLDDTDITALGGWPLKRSYYALLIDALNDLGAKVIGFDIFLDDSNPLYAEFDSLLVRVASKYGNVVFASYFGSLASIEGIAGEDFGYDTVEEGGFLSGGNLHLPHRAFLRAAESTGHTNLPSGSTVRSVPIFIRSGKKLFPSLSFEMARLFFDIERKQVSARTGVAILGIDGGAHRFPLSEDGRLTVNYQGGLSSLSKYRFIDFLQSYDLYRAGSGPWNPILNVKGKVVLVGVIAAGLSKFVSTPYTPNFPGIGVHATTLDNFLNNRFLRVSSPLARHLISVVFAYAVFLLVVRMRGSAGVAVAGAILFLYLTINLAIFLLFSVSLPAVQPVAMVLLMTIAALIFKQKRVRQELTLVEFDKERVEKELREKEKLLLGVEAELRQTRDVPELTPENILREKIKQYREDIRMLSLQAGDFSPYFTPIEDAENDRQEFEGLVYSRSGKMHEIISLVKKVAPSDASVFILGESGTGKELVARAVHSKSNRWDKPFITVNCGALTESLLESELFGHERGAFTGAVRERAGRFELANGGTIFLDEITETSEAFQVKLLRVLQSGEFERVGGTKTMKVNVRVVAATNRNANEEIQQKRFREDLYYRLSVFTTHLLPLRERKSDIPYLVDYFLKREDGSFSLSSTVMDILLNYDWRGNVRELESVIKRATILARADSRDLIRVKDLPDEIAASLRKKAALEDQILALLREKRFSRSSISESAEDLGGLNRGTVAEYFRGLCFETFYEQELDLERAALALADTDDSAVVERVRKKMREYLANVVESLDISNAVEKVKSKLAPKYKNLPQRYHFFLDQLIESCHRGEWKLPDITKKSKTSKVGV